MEIRAKEVTCKVLMFYHGYLDYYSRITGKSKTRRLASAYFSPDYKYFDQLLQMVKNKTTVVNLVFKEFLQTSIPPLISVLYAKGYHTFPSKLFCLTVPNNFVEEPFCVSESFGYRKILCLRGEYHDFL